MELKRAIATGALVGILLATFLVSPMFSGTVEAAQYSPPWADRFTTTYPPPDATTYNANWLEWMGAAGYSRSSWVNPIAAFATNSKMPSDAVFSFFGHGNKGYAFFWNAVYGSTCIRADNGMDWPRNWLGQVTVNTTWSSSLNETPDLWDLRLMMLEGCYTACRKNSSYDYTSLTEQAVTYQGVDCAVGFTTTISAPKANTWDYYFWREATEGNNVEYCCSAACAFVYCQYGTYGGTNNYDIAGDWLVIVPAAYGT